MLLDAAGTISIEHNQCNDGPFTEQAIGTNAKLGRAFDEMNFAIKQGKQDFGRTRDSVSAQLSDGSSSYYDIGDDKIILEKSGIAGEWAIFITAHEYGHAYDAKALGGTGDGNCPEPHYLSGAHNLTCAFVEGFVDFYAGWTRRDLSSSEYSYPDNFENNICYPAGNGTGDPDDGSLIEGAVAAFLFDLVDPANESHDAAAFPGSYLADVWATCAGGGIRADRIDWAIWCYEDQVDGNSYNTYFPNSYAPSGQSHSATRPSNWSQQAVRDLWLENLYGNW